nr:Imm26 family immunity protein [Pseudoalteromonas sp. XMcav2-N]
MQKPYRKKLLVGDVFQLQYPGSRFVFGQIISLSASAGGFEDCIKIYVFNHIANKPENFSYNEQYQLMCEPLFINRLGFSRGFMPVVNNVPLIKVMDNLEWCFFLSLLKSIMMKWEICWTLHAVKSVPGG